MIKTKKEDTIRSIWEFERRYFPNAAKKKEEDEMSPQMIGNIWARETIQKIRKIIKAKNR